jgi:hypothetical protein
MEYKKLSDAESRAVAEELSIPVGEFFALLLGAIVLLLFFFAGPRFL